MLVNGQLVCLWSVGILNPVKFNLNYLFQAFARPLALVLQILLRVNKGIAIIIISSSSSIIMIIINITYFRLKYSDRKNRTPFSDVPLLPEIFRWNDLKSRVPLTFQPDFPETFCNGKNPNFCLEHSDRTKQDYGTFSDVPMLPEIFHSNNLKSRVPYVLQPDLPDTFCTWWKTLIFTCNWLQCFNQSNMYSNSNNQSEFNWG